MKYSKLLALLPVLAFAACAGDTSSPTAVDLTAALDHLPLPDVQHFEVCKEYRGTFGPAAIVDWTMTRPNGDDLSGFVELAEDECQVVYSYNEENSDGGLEPQTVTVTEREVAGYVTSYILTVREAYLSDPITYPEAPGNTVSGALTSNPDNSFVVTFVNSEVLDNRMTGGGSFFASDVRFTHGFELRCDLGEPNRLQVNWEGNRFHMTDLTWARCTDDPDFDEGKPVAGFDTFEGYGIGRFNGVDGFGIHFIFVDDGEPGTSDLAWLVITTPDGLTDVAVASNVLDRGNHQAHK